MRSFVWQLSSMQAIALGQAVPAAIAPAGRVSEHELQSLADLHALEGILTGYVSGVLLELRSSISRTCAWSHKLMLKPCSQCLKSQR